MDSETNTSDRSPSSEPSGLRHVARTAGISAALALGVCALLVPTLEGMRHGYGTDEAYYLRYMEAVHEHGLAVLPRVTEEWNSGSENWIYPPPTRIGLSAATGLWSLVRPPSMRSLSEFSIACTAAFVVLSYLCARRVIGEFKALLLAVLLIGNCLALGLGRRALSDAANVLFQGASIWSFYFAMQAPAKWGRRMLFTAVFAATILTKEIGALLSLAFLASVPVCFPRDELWTRLRVAVGSIGAAVSLSILGWVTAAGGLDPWLLAISKLLGSPATNEWAQAFCSGPWQRYVVDQFLLSPWTSALGLLAFGATLRGRAEKCANTPLLYLIVLYVVQLTVLAPFMKNARFGAILELPLRLGAVVFLVELLLRPDNLRRRIAVAAVVLAVAAAQVRDFRAIFVEGQLYDPLTVHLVRHREMSPPLKSQAEFGTLPESGRARGRRRASNVAPPEDE